jgi:transposase InsO family protein
MIEPAEAGYTRAKWLLDREYGQPTILAAAYRSKAETWPQITAGDKNDLQKFSVFLTNFCSARISNQDLAKMDSYDFLRTLASKLHVGIQQRWIHKVGRLRDEEKRSPTLEDFEQFVGQLARDENDPRIAGLGYQRVKGEKGTTAAPKKRVFATAVQSQNFQKSSAKQTAYHDKPGNACIYCGPDTRHSVLECRKFKAIKHEDKSQFCKTKGLCFGCLRTGHRKKECRNLEKCETCGKKHPTVLHDSNYKPRRPDANSEVTPVKVTTGCVSAGCMPTRMTILPVTVTSAGGPCIKTYAFLDSGCGAVFASLELCANLHVRTKNTKLLLKTLADEQMCETQVVQDQLQVGDVNGVSFVDLPDVYVKDMPVTDEDIPKQRDIDKWTHLQDIRLPDLEETENSHCVIPRVSLMIGSNVPAASQPLECRTGKIGQPYAVKSPLGWMIHGLVSKGTQKSVAAHFCNVRNPTSIQRSDEHLEQLFTNYVNKDFDEKPGNETRPSVEDKKFLKLMEETIEQEPDGHFKTALPFRDKNIHMPNNRPQAEAYANSLRKRLVKDSNLCEQYTQFMEDLEANGYAERVPEGELVREDGRQWYVPHHGVFNPHKPGKIRVVYNCPAAYMGVSLNKLLLQGPDLTNGLTGVLMRWRKEPVAVLADIESMFYQTRVAKEDRDMLRYLWWPDGNLNNKLQDYRMCVHVFGAVSSPSCANYVLRKIAEDCDNKKPKVAEAILNSFYVDDMLKSFATEHEAIEVSKSIQKTLQEGGFKLTKWLSNSRMVIESFPPDERAKEVKHLDLDVDTLPTDRALGIKWNAETDHLGFSYSMNEKWSVVTRRSLLSIISSVYDPMGMVAPFVMKAKMILQVLCQDKIGWDDEIPQQQAQEWKQWTKELPKLEEVKLNRCLKPASFKNPRQIQLHHFADASEKGYGVVSYIRYLEGTKIHCSFMIAKSRVRPLKKITIPRLELTAALIAVRVDSKLKSEWRMCNKDDEISSQFWTDSLTVMKYIRNETSRFHTFVANRVEEIRERSEPSQWHYVPTRDNPADDCSRGLTMEKLLKTDRWFQGPHFLWKEESEWPECKLSSLKTLSTEDPEVRKSGVCNSGSSVKVGVGVVKYDELQDPVIRIINQYSDWMKLKRIIAWCLRLRVILQQRSKEQEPRQQTKYLTVEELQNAEEAIIKKVQQQAFPTEILALQKYRERSEQRINGEQEEAKQEDTETCKMIPSRSTILNLDPVLSNGLLRVGGRLGKAPIPEDAKHQLILPRNNHVSDMILDYIHRQCNHQGRNHVLAVSRQKYWILGAGVKVKHLMKRCVVCRKQRCQLNQQMMADLPAQRVKPDNPPFTYTGMDFFGPYEIKHGRSMRKRYGVVFTCMNCRAVHIEITDSMNTSACINAIRRFIARRGPVQEITSDNGSNLVGASRELHEALKELDEKAIQMFACNHEIKWNFNTPTASHQGGVWERMIRTVRKILQSMLMEQHLKVARSDDELHTLMCEVEATINARPLTRMSEDPRDSEPLTPNHLLQLRNPSCIPPGVFNEKDAYSRRRWRQVQFLADLFWKRWVAEYLPMLQTRQKWLQPQRNLAVGDIVLIADNTAPRNSWPMGRVEKINIGSKGLVRSATVKTKTTRLDRPVSKLCLLLEMET